jgi:hypothetical protein
MEKIMKSFRNFVKNSKVNEGPVGQVGRSAKNDIADHIEDSALEKEFQKIVEKLGGIEVSRELLQRIDTNSDLVSVEDDKTLAEGKETPQKYLRDAGYKIKSEDPTKKGFEIEFFKDKDAQSAKEDLESAGFAKDFSFSAAGKFLEFIEL